MRSIVGVTATVFVLLLTACGGGAPQTPAPSPSPSSASAGISTSGGTLVFPSVAGYSGTFVYSSNDAAAGTMATIATIASPGAGMIPAQLPPGTMLAAFQLTLDHKVTFTNWNHLLTTITIPASISTNGHVFNEYGYDNSVGEGYNLGTVSGTTISFGSGFGPVTLLAGHTYLIVLTMQ